jgi:hypothetical protein
MKVEEIFMNLLEDALSEKIGINSLIKLKATYPKLELDFLRLGVYPVYNKVRVLISHDDIIDVEFIQDRYNEIYLKEMYLEINNIIKKLI